ncbi:hypothetical protein [Peterkaempfera sp. SMS 1(5)a]|uniref:hypothetical protein n=1 Tax=Peterkaempfera podocarpi TaxID=3232308 RepID=UPI00366D4E04
MTGDSTMRMKRVVSVAVATAGLVGMTLATAPVASAAPISYDPPVCDIGFACLYYHSSSYALAHKIDVNGSWRLDFGAKFETAANISDFAGWIFSASLYGSEGAGQSVKNNAAYVSNFSDTQTYRVYYNSGYNCSVACQDFFGVGDLNSQMINNNASGKFL